MRITERQFENIVILDLHGPFAGLKAAEAVTDKMTLLRRDGVRHVVTSLRDVPSVDLAGLSALFEAYRAMGNAGGTFKLACVSERIDDLVVLTRLLTVFDTYDSVEEAVGGPIPTYVSAQPVAPQPIAFWTLPRFMRGA
jgi:anti-sigma B factor antagonist